MMIDAILYFGYQADATSGNSRFAGCQTSTVSFIMLSYMTWCM